MLIGAQQATQKVVSSNLTWQNWVAAAVILAIAFVAGRVGKVAVCRIIGRPEGEARAVDVIGRFVSSIAIVAGLIYALAALGIRLGALVGALGIGGLAIAFAAQSILANFLASVILQVRRPFRRGDQIATNDCEGTVEDVNFRTVVLRTYGGQRVMVPCADVLGKPIVNHTVAGRRRTTLDVGVAYDSDLDLTRQVLLDAVRRVDGVREQPGPEVWVESLGTSSINVVVRFWHAPDQASLWRVRSAVATAVKRALDEAGIEMPFPQRVLRFADDGSGERRADRNGNDAADLLDRAR
jgi:small-conductance mechanosensitive channel